MNLLLLNYNFSLNFIEGFKFKSTSRRISRSHTLIKFQRARLSCYRLLYSFLY
ncbi:unnamed protein product [Meloidogyne enterolobii]|uniref:Uncharacterized protein n=1 Tax=Meloidogyne enterolobii TaxID=390850 RepID=A0ACB1AWL7_MELEN